MMLAVFPKITSAPCTPVGQHPEKPSDDLTTSLLKMSLLAWPCTAQRCHRTHAAVYLARLQSS